MKTVLVFVLSANTWPYGAMMHSSMATWDAEPVDGVRTVFYHGNPMQPQTERIVSFPVDEDYLTISRKNLMAFEWALTQTWDYMARVNSSCYVHKQRLLEAVQGLPETGLVRGVLCDPTEYCGVRRKWMWGGAQFLFSRDVVEAFVKNAHKMNHVVMEDVALGELAQDCGFTLDGSGKCCSINVLSNGGWQAIEYGENARGCTFMDFSEINQLPDQFFFRVKHDPDRTVDRHIMELLKANLK